MGRKKQPLKPGPPSQPLPAQGKGGRKRTPTSAFDPAAGAAIAAALEPEKTFTVEKLVASRLKSGVKEYLVRWEGYGDKHDSWEPMENLSNLVEEMAAFLCGFQLRLMGHCAWQQSTGSGFGGRGALDEFGRAVNRAALSS